jgi:hypothetical protein
MYCTASVPLLAKLVLLRRKKRLATPQIEKKKAALSLDG